jgi:hypothetical protein
VDWSLPVGEAQSVFTRTLRQETSEVSWCVLQTVSSLAEVALLASRSGI